MKVSTLTIEMAANVARLRQDMDSAQKTVDNAMAGISSAVKTAMGVFAALGAAVSVSALMGWVRGAIDAADSVSKLAQKTGLAVKEVGGLQLAFRQAGVEDGLQTSLARLAKEASKGNDAFAAMGVTVKNSDGGLKSTRELIGEVADKFASYKDGAEKTALAQELFGKSGADLIPLLNAGASALDEYDKTAAALGLTLSDETAKSAEAFNDTLDLMGQSSQGVARQVAAQLLPTLNVLAGELFGAVTNTDFLTGAADALSFAFRALYSVGVGVVQAFKTVGIALGGVGAAIAAVLRGDFAQVNDIGNQMAHDIGVSWAEAGASIKRAWGDTQNTTVSAMAAIAAEGKKAAPIVSELTDGNKAHKKAIDDTTKSMADEAKVLAELSGLSGHFYKDWDLLDAAYKKGTLSLDGLLEKQAELLAKQPAMVAAAKEQIEAAKASNAAFDEQFKAIEAVREATEGRIKSAREMLESIERETSLMGLSNDEREQTIALFELERQGVVKGTEAYDAYAQKIKQAIAVRSGKQATQELNKATLAEWTKTVDKYDDIFRGGFADMLNNGKGAWDSFTTSLTTTFKTSVADQIYKMFAQPFVVKFVGSMLGIVGGVAGGVANAGSAASTGLSVLSGASSLANIAGSAGALGTATGAISGFTTALTAGAQSLVGITGTTAQMVTSLTAAGHIAAPGVAAGVSAGSSITTALGSIGPVGWAAIAVLAVAAIASGRGETRSGASYITGKDGQAVKEMGPSGGEIAGDQVRALFDTTTTGINSLLKSLGSQASVSAFVAGLESSKAGKGFVYAGGTLSTGAKFGEAGGRNGGEFAFGGQTAEEAIKGYALQLKQATLQALSAAGDIPKQITAILGSVDVTTVAEGVLDDLMGQINAFVVGVGNMQSAFELLPINYLKNLSFATAAGLAEAAGGFDQFGASLGTFYDKFYSESEKTANSTANLSRAFAAMNIVMPAVDDNTRAWYRSEVERLGAMDLSIEANAKAYTSVLSLSSAVDALAPAMKAAADATKAAADATKSTTDSALRSLTAAIEAEQKRIGLIRDLAAESVSSITSVFDLLKEQVAQLYGSVGSTNTMQAAQGNAFIDAALAAVKSTGYLPDSTQLADAIAAARGGLDASQFTSQFEADKAALVMAGKLSQIQAAAGKQLTSAEQSLRVADDQLAALDKSLEYYKTQVDLLRGIDTSVLTVAGAIAALQVAMTAEKSASTAPGAKATASATTGAGYAPAGQGPATPDTGFKDRIYLQTGIVGTAITDIDRIGRLDSISAYLSEGHSIKEIAETAIKYGVTQKDLAAASGYTDYDVRKTFEGLGIPAYANGGDHAGGLRLVGEKSWEIEATGPSRIWNPQQLGDALRGGGGGNDQTDVADELRQLREENRAQARVVAQLLSDMNKRQREWDTNGLPTERAMA